MSTILSTVTHFLFILFVKKTIGWGWKEGKGREGRGERGEGEGSGGEVSSSTLQRHFKAIPQIASPIGLNLIRGEALKRNKIGKVKKIQGYSTEQDWQG